MAGARAVVPADYPPAVDSRREFIRRELDDEDETTERLGEDPVCAIDKTRLIAR